MSVPRKPNLGDLEMLVLVALIRLAPNAYGVAVREEIERRAGRSLSIGALYTTLSRLEEKGLVTSHLGEATAERGGRAKKFYQVTAAGQSHLERSLSAVYRMAEGTKLWPAAKKT